MANIPGTVFMIIGAVVAIVSLFLEEIRFFVIIGVLFFLYGGIKALAKKKKPKPHKIHHPHCPFCNKMVKTHDNFCSHCGGYLKHQRSNPYLHNSGHNQGHYTQNNQVRRVP